MKSISGKQLCRILERKGWELKTIKGSHHVYMMDGRTERISVPVHGNKDLKIGMLKAIMKLAEIEESEL
ncbi:MAG: type II toxin-antitoxin system HicA family toxin [Deltaproteobacteria bacterium]|nr:type II toxin-antitoxin system HicA family toxin [Deltaproteobacteria bacterium]